nr:biotin--[acetyl-CoA-carboxylase] ligase [Eggerthellaceae bacterium]
MSTREQLLTLLSQAALNQTWVSGEDAARQLGVSRAAIWKAIKTLEEEGYHFEAQRNRGYRMAEHQDVITKSDLDAALASAKLPVETQVVFSTGSTNNDVKSLAEQGKEELFALVASKQESGKGRRGRSFFSLGDRGVYLSILIRPSMPIAQASAITAVAAVATCRAVESLFDVKPSIKWVNDVYLGKHKICGILTEAATDLETGMLSYAVVGIGVNVYEPEGGFPEEI